MHFKLIVLAMKPNGFDESNQNLKTLFKRYVVKVPIFNKEMKKKKPPAQTLRQIKLRNEFCH